MIYDILYHNIFDTNIYVYTHVQYIHTFLSLSLYIYIYIYMYIDLWISLSLSLSLYMYIYIYIYMCMLMYCKLTIRTLHRLLLHVHYIFQAIVLISRRRMPDVRGGILGFCHWRPGLSQTPIRRYGSLHTAWHRQWSQLSYSVLHSTYTIQYIHIHMLMMRSTQNRTHGT